MASAMGRGPFDADGQGPPLQGSPADAALPGSQVGPSGPVGYPLSAGGPPAPSAGDQAAHHVLHILVGVVPSSRSSRASSFSSSRAGFGR